VHDDSARTPEGVDEWIRAVRSFDIESGRDNERRFIVREPVLVNTQVVVVMAVIEEEMVIVACSSVFDLTVIPVRSLSCATSIEVMILIAFSVPVSLSIP